MRLRRAEKKDIKQLCHLEESLFEKENFPLSKSSFRYHLQNNLIYLAELDKEIVGYILVLIKRKDAKIYSLGVSKQHRGKGIASLLIKKVLKELKEIGFVRTKLEVRTDNRSAISLYKSFGFTNIKRVNSFYLDGCDAYIMGLDHGL